MLLDGPDVGRFLQHAAELATTMVVPPAACGIALRRDDQLSTVAHSGELAIQADEIQYGRGQGPCLESVRTAMIIHVADLATDERWPSYRSHALAHGVRSSLSLPLIVDGYSVGALNLYIATPHDFHGAEVAQASAFAAQTSIALTIVLRHADQVALEDQLRTTLATRAVIDQALGIVMGQRACTASDAFAVLREASQHRNRKLHEIAAELIETITGQPPQPPRPFIRRR
ncbi:MAG: GAF and ANTAR domain-containing protein [Jatrophihabitantaceae bacterium]